MSDFWRESRPLARKKHLCWSCSRVIEPGETYKRGDGKYDGELQTLKTCAQCERFMADAYAHGIIGEGQYGEETYPYLPDAIGDEDIDTLGPIWHERCDLFRSQWKRAGELVAYPATTDA